MGQSKGFDFQCRTAGGYHAGLMDARNQLLGWLCGPRLIRVRPNGWKTSGIQSRVDWQNSTLDFPFLLVHNTISTAFGTPTSITSFKGRVKRVYVQADAPYRMLPKDLEKTLCAE